MIAASPPAEFAASVPAPARQGVHEVRRKLPGEPGNGARALRLGTMAGRARGNVGFRQAGFEDLPAEAEISARAPAERRRVQGVEMRRDRADHGGRNAASHIGHHGIDATPGRVIAQLGFEIIGLLARKPRDRVITVKPLPGLAVADLAIFDLGLDAAVLSSPRRTGTDGSRHH